MDIQRVETYIKRVAESETNTFTPVGDKLKVGLDLGTAYIVMVVLDEENNPIACEKQAADVLRDGVSRSTEHCKSSEGKTGAANWKRTGKLCHCHAGRN